MRFVDLGFADRFVDYNEAWDLQRQTQQQVRAGECEDTVYLLEHAPVYTAGRRTQPHERPFDGTPVVDVDRGGKITWHGPGQLVCYPIVRLQDPVDAVRYVRCLEEALIGICDSVGVSGAHRIKGRSGVWLAANANKPDRKVAAIGVRVAQGVTTHGFALGCNNELTAFHNIVPCGIVDAGVTTLSEEAGHPVTVQDVLPAVRRLLPEALAPVLANEPGQIQTHSMEVVA